MLKKIIVPILVLVVLLTGCSSFAENETTDGITTVDTTEAENENTEFFKGAWISYFELHRSGRTEEEYRQYLEELFLNASQVGITDIFLHVRASGEAVYTSALFPPAEYICEEEEDLPFDVLRMSLDTAKKYSMNIHAWINPYRAYSVKKAESVPACKMKNWIETESSNMKKVGERYFFNPSSSEVRALITDGVREILTEYPEVKGIHIDDYFYPENCGDFDSQEYSDYISQGGTLSLYDWRRENVNSLVSGIYAAVKSFGEDKIFSVSPSGDIEKNYNTLYADVELWSGVRGYCDMIMPQIYFGFENEKLPFVPTLERWCSLTENSEVKLVVGLALYKCGQEDIYAGEKGKDEWINNTDIIKRQVECIKDRKIDGFSLYSTSFINFSESFLSQEMNNLKSVL